MEYIAPDNIYWLFSSSAQSIAAFIGFLAAGFFFAHEILDRQVEKDSSLEEIYADIKIQYYTQLKVLFILTGFSISLSLVVIYLNGFECGIWGSIFKIIVAILNILTIYRAIAFVIFIINPNKVQKTTEKLIRENKEIFQPEENNIISGTEFFSKFVQLERVLREIAEGLGIIVHTVGRYKSVLSLMEIIKELYNRGVITPQQLRDLIVVNKIRNLVAHGEIKNIDKRQGVLIDELIAKLGGFLDFQQNEDEEN